MITHPTISFTRYINLKIITFLTWFCAAASLVFWFLHLISVHSENIVHHLTSPETVLVSHDHVETALGKIVNSPVVLPESNKFRVMGLISSSTGFGSALISINGEPAKAFKTGQQVLGDWTLYGVSPRGVKLHNKNSFDELEIQMPINHP